MTLSKRGDYVTRAAIALARAHGSGGPRKIREVVAETDVPATFAAQILSDLVRAGLATSKAGRVGGYRLARPPETITVLEVIEAGEGPLRSERCALGEGPCRWEAVCPLHETWTAATAELRGLLSGTTLAELAARDEAIEAGTYRVPADSHRSHPGSMAVADTVQIELGEAELRRVLERSAGDLPALVVSALGGTGQVEATWDTAGPPAGGPAPGMHLGWQVRTPRRTTRLEAEARVMPVDPHRAEISVEGRWHQHGDPAALLDQTALEQEARGALRAFLRHVARALEQMPASSVPPAETRDGRGTTAGLSAL